MHSWGMIQRLSVKVYKQTVLFTSSKMRSILSVPDATHSIHETLVKNGYLKFSRPSAAFRNMSSIILMVLRLFSDYPDLCKIDLDLEPLACCWRNLGTRSELLGNLFSWAMCDENTEITQSNYGSDKAQTLKAKMLQCLQTRTVIPDSSLGAKTHR